MKGNFVLFFFKSKIRINSKVNYFVQTSWFTYSTSFPSNINNEKINNYNLYVYILYKMNRSTLKCSKSGFHDAQLFSFWPRDKSFSSWRKANTTSSTDFITVDSHTPNLLAIDL